MHELLQVGVPRNQDRLDTETKRRSFLASRWLTLAVPLSGLFIYLQVFVLPSTPRLATGDQAIYLHHAVRMLDGQMIYRDYDHFTVPGTDVLYMVLFKVFGVQAWIPQAMLIVLGMSMLCLINCISRALLSGTSALLPALLFVTLPFSSYLDATHHWYSALATTGALAVLIHGRSFVRLLWSGVLLGVATMFTQSMALLTVGFGLFLLWERKREGQTRNVLVKKEACLLAGFLFTITGSLAYFVWTVGLKQLLYYTVVFVLKYYPADWFNNWRVYLTGRPRLHVWTTWLDLPAFALIHLIVPFVYIVFFAYALKKRRQSNVLRSGLVLVSLTGLFLFLTVASAPAYSRLYVVSPPALILMAWFLNSPPGKRIFLQSLWAGALVLAVARPLVTQIRWRAYLDLPTGRTAFFEPVLYEKCEWMSQRTRPSDYFFGDHQLAFTLRLRNVGRVPFLRPTDYTRPAEVEDAIQALERFQVQFVSWYRGLDHETDAARHPEGDHLAPIRSYLKEHYHVAQTFSNGDQIWERNQ